MQKLGLHAAGLHNSTLMQSCDWKMRRYFCAILRKKMHGNKCIENLSAQKIWPPKEHFVALNPPC